MVEAQNDAYSSAFIRQLCLIAGKSFFFQSTVFLSLFRISVFQCFSFLSEYGVF